MHSICVTSVMIDGFLLLCLSASLWCSFAPSSFLTSFLPGFFSPSLEFPFHLNVLLLASDCFLKLSKLDWLPKQMTFPEYVKGISGWASWVEPTCRMMGMLVSKLGAAFVAERIALLNLFNQESIQEEAAFSTHGVKRKVVQEEASQSQGRTEHIHSSVSRNRLCAFLLRQWTHHTLLPRLAGLADAAFTAPAVLNTPATLPSEGSLCVPKVTSGAHFRNPGSPWMYSPGQSFQPATPGLWI